MIYPGVKQVNSGAETRIFPDYLANTIAADALAPGIARPSATMVLIM